MKKIYIIRHAEAEGSAGLKEDFQRALSAQGKSDAERMGRTLTERNAEVTLMLSSAAYRALTTCSIIADGLGYAAQKIQADKSIYNADLSQLIAIIRKVDDRHAAIMVFGHNPACTALVNSLLGGNCVRLPPCGVVAANLTIPSWKYVEPACGKMVFFDVPKASW